MFAYSSSSNNRSSQGAGGSHVNSSGSTVSNGVIIGATVSQPQQPQQQQEEDEWSDFVSVTAKSPKRKPITSHAQGSTTTTKASAGEDDWTDFVSSAPAAGPNFTPWGASTSYQYSQTVAGRTPTPAHIPPRLGSHGPEMQFADPSPFFISSTAAGLQSMFGGGGVGGHSHQRKDSGRK